MGKTSGKELERKKALLEGEGLTFDQGKIRDFERKIWK